MTRTIIGTRLQVWFWAAYIGAAGFTFFAEAAAVKSADELIEALAQ